MAAINSSDIVVSSLVNAVKNNFNGNEIIKYYIHDTEGWQWNLNTNPSNYTYTYEHYLGEENYIDYIFNSIDPHISLDFEKANSASEGDIDIYMLGNWSSPSSLGFTNVNYGKTAVYWYATNEYSYIGYGSLQDNDAYTLIHEIGHALGLSHPQLNGVDDPYGSWHNSNDTVMSYNYIASSNPPPWTTIDIQALIDIWGPEGSNSPTNIILSSSNFDENIEANSSIATLSTVDADKNESFTYTLANGVGDTDNNFFTIDGLYLKINSSPDYEVKSSYNIRIKTTDSNDNTFEKTFSLSVNDLAEGITKLYSGNSFDYTFINEGNNKYGIKADNSSQIDTITGLSTVQFADKYIDVSKDVIGVFDQVTGLNTDSGKMFRLYNAAFARFPDADGLRYWINNFSSGIDDERAVSLSFLASDEFKQRYGDNITNETYVENLYLNVLNRELDQSGYNYWVGNLNNGTEQRHEVLLGFSESTENKIFFTEMTGLS